MQFRRKQYCSPISALSKCVVSEQLAVVSLIVDSYFVILLHTRLPHAGEPSYFSGYIAYFNKTF